MKIDFWQLSHDPVEKVVGLIAQRVLAAGDRLLVVSEDAGQRKAISRALWKSAPDSFLANGEAASKGASDQPILLSEATDPVNSANHIVFADGKYRDVPGFEREFLLFDETTLQPAREVWRSLDGKEDLERSFYRQDNGKWVKVS